MHSIVLYCIVLNCFTCVAFILYLYLFVYEAEKIDSKNAKKTSFVSEAN